MREEQFLCPGAEGLLQLGGCYRTILDHGCPFFQCPDLFYDVG